MKILYFLSLTLCLTLIAAQLNQPITTCSAKCPKGCSTCNGTHCITCLPGFVLSQSTCQPIPCSISNCSLCSEQGACLLCSDPYDHFNGISGSCQLSCPLQNCQKCQQYSSKCDKCSPGYWLYTWDGKCHLSPIERCLEGFDWRGQNYQCLRCQQGYRPTMDQLQCMKDECRGIMNCQKCANNSFCQLCREGFTFTGSECEPYNCSIPNCLTCSLSGQCYKCSSGLALTDNRCQAAVCPLENCLKCKPFSNLCDLCTPPYIYNIWSQSCEKIQTAPAALNCQSVARSGRYYTCVTCLEGYTFTNTNKVACKRQCPQFCLQCQVSTACQQCQVGYTLVGTQCNKNICQVEGCELCSPEGACLKCTNEYYRYGEEEKKCVQKCELSHCQRCRSGSSQCQLCLEGYSLSEWKESCIVGVIENCVQLHDWKGQEYRCSRCIQGYVPTKDSTQCSVITCSFISNCRQCNNSSLCDACYSGYHPSNGGCLKNKCEVQYCLQCSQEGTCIKPVSSHYLLASVPTPKKCELPNCLICKPGSSFCDTCNPGYQIDPWSNVCSGLSQQSAGGDSPSNLKYLWLLLLLAGVIAVAVVVKLTRMGQEEQAKETLKKKMEEEEKKKKLVKIENPLMLYVIKNVKKANEEHCSEGSSVDHPSLKTVKGILVNSSPTALEPSQIEVQVLEENDPGPFSPTAHTNDRILPQQSFHSELNGELSEGSIRLPALKVRGRKQKQAKKEEPFIQ